MNRWLRLLAPIAGLVAFILLFAILSGSPERSGDNLRVVVAQTVIVAAARWRVSHAAQRS